MRLGLLILLFSLLWGGVSVGNTQESDSFPYLNLYLEADRDFPYLIDSNGTLLRPDEEGVWHQLPLDVPLLDVYAEYRGTIWAATPDGLYSYKDDAWEKVNDFQGAHLDMTHGHLFLLGDGQLLRGVDEWRELTPPLADEPMTSFTMLPDHSHLLVVGERLFRTIDLGLSWTEVEVPAPVLKLMMMGGHHGTLVIATPKGFYKRDGADWKLIISLQQNRLPDSTTIFKDRLYVVYDHILYRQEGQHWLKVKLPDEAPVVAVASWADEGLWILTDVALFSSGNGKDWSEVPIVVAEN